MVSVQSTVDTGHEVCTFFNNVTENLVRICYTFDPKLVGPSVRLHGTICLRPSLFKTFS